MVTARFARYAAILLLAWQALVVQAHLHAPEGVGAPVASARHAALSATHPKPDTPADCPVCREIAHAGQYLASGAPAYVAPVVATLGPTTVSARALGLGRPAHHWRSRAPPLLPLS